MKRLRWIFFIIGTTIIFYSTKIYAQEILVKFKNKINFYTVYSNELAALDSSFTQFPTIEILPLTSKLIRNKTKLELFSNLGIDRWTKIRYHKSVDPQKLISILNEHPAVEFAQFNQIFRIHDLPDDPRISEQWLIDRIQLENAWEKTFGKRNVIITIIDTGIDYYHEDLHSNVWINLGEDLNANGLIEESDFNGIDDDNNGFVDDIHGWDFTDAPHFPDGGDFLDRDNDPMDEHGHGTQIAGIIGATANNGIGIAGVAPGCQIMNLRAGTSQGLLEEDDVASAIIYAVDNGARIINMSFGDVATSQMLRDVIEFAYHCGVVLIASAGNSASPDVHYPSGFLGTISVGATGEEDVLAGFSNYGPTVDLVAPGVSLLTTEMGNKYGAFSGTSASTPVVSGVVGLMLSVRPELTNQDVRNILTSSTDDLGEPGWDQYYAAGRLNANRALQVDYVSQATITAPRLDQGIYASPVIIEGTASGALLNRYELFYGFGKNPSDWFLITEVTGRQIVNDTLGTWFIDDLPDSSYILRLNVENKDGSAVEHQTRVFIDRTLPELLSLNRTKILDGNRYSQLLEFETDDISRASIFYREPDTGNPFREISLNYEVKIHRFNFVESGSFEFYIKLQNKSGLVAIHDTSGHYYKLELLDPDIETSRFTLMDFELPSLYLFHKVSDFDGDGNIEIIANPRSEKQAFGNLMLFEFEGGKFREIPLSSHVAIPKDWGDSDNDGLLEILVGAGPISFIFESEKPGSYPRQRIWENTEDFWASRFADLDQDGKMEIIARVENTFEVYENSGDNQYQKVGSFPNPTEGSNGTGIPHTEVGDFDSDGKFEILMGDYDGDIYIYEAIGDNRYLPTWHNKLPLMDAIDFIASGDYDADGVAEFAAGCHSSSDLDLEHEYDGRYWIFRIYDTVGDNQFQPVWEQAFFGFAYPADFASGISSGDIDNDGQDELLINIFPDFYVIDFEQISGIYIPVGYFYPSRSRTNVITDIDGDGTVEFFLNTGEKVIALQDRSGSVAIKLPAPAGFLAFPLDENSVFMEWINVTGAVGYRIYRGKSAGQLFPLTDVFTTSFIDTTVQADSLYWYAVSAVESHISQLEGKNSAPISVRPGARPYCLSANFFEPNQVRLKFSEQMDASILDVSAYYLSNDMGQPISAIDSRLGQEILLTFESHSFEPGNYSIEVTGVRDKDRTPIDTTRNSIAFKVPGVTSPFYLTSASLIESQSIALDFNLPVDPTTASDKTNYTIEPAIQIEKVTTSKNNHQIILQIDKNYPVGALGFNYIITVQNIFSQSGDPIQQGQGSQASLIFYQNDLSQVFTYPNPCRVGSGENSIMFANLTKEATVKILTLSGQVIRTLKETDGNGGLSWDLRNEGGEMVSSGIYIFYIFSENDSKQGKLTIVK